MRYTYKYIYLFGGGGGGYTIKGIRSSYFLSVDKCKPCIYDNRWVKLKSVDDNNFIY